jgi:hypothetical protein
MTDLRATDRSQGGKARKGPKSGPGQAEAALALDPLDPLDEEPEELDEPDDEEPDDEEPDDEEPELSEEELLDDPEDDSDLPGFTELVVEVLRESVR